MPSSELRIIDRKNNTKYVNYSWTDCNCFFCILRNNNAPTKKNTKKNKIELRILPSGNTVVHQILTNTCVQKKK